MSWFEHKGLRIYYEVDGNGEPLLLLPGWGGSIGELAGVRQQLAQKYQVVSADLPGSGRSTPQPREYLPGYFSEDAEAMLALLQEMRATPARVVGFSDGGEDALLMAIMQPNALKSVVVWGAAGQLQAPPGMLEAFAELIDHPIPPLAGFSEYLKAAYGESNARSMVRSVASALARMIEAGGNISFSRAAEIKCPVLLIAGEHDPFAPPSLVSELASVIATSTFIEAKGAGHDVHSDRPEWLAEAVIDWLSHLSEPGEDAKVQTENAVSKLES